MLADADWPRLAPVHGPDPRATRPAANVGVIDRAIQRWRQTRE